MTRRRSVGERLAPWILMVVLVALWWAGAKVVRWAGFGAGSAAPSPVVSAPAGDATLSRNPVSPFPAAPALPSPSPEPAAPAAAIDSPAAPAPPAPADVSSSETASITSEDLENLRGRVLTVPVQGVASETLVQTYEDAREGSRPHEGLDILAARGTPVLAVEQGRIAKLFTSERGGLTIYQLDPSGQFAYYYAHLDGYAEGLQEGAAVTKGQTLGYVGTTGNAPPQTPHLHFQIFKLGAERVWWKGTPLDPFSVFRP